ncbi:MAG: hypothetical protein ACK528_09500 [Alphaproteobacteria bacterium]
MFRTALAACAAAAVMTIAPAMAQAPARCEATSVRVYFGQGQSTLDETTMEMLAIAERNMADCEYTELHVVMDGANPQSRARGAAVLAALDEEAWDVARVEQRASTQRISQAPEYAEVVMSPTPVRMGDPLRDPNAGV